jgi:hypothetical protein
MLSIESASRKRSAESETYKIMIGKTRIKFRNGRAPVMDRAIATILVLAAKR